MSGTAWPTRARADSTPCHQGAAPCDAEPRAAPREATEGFRTPTGDHGEGACARRLDERRRREVDACEGGHHVGEVVHPVPADALHDGTPHFGGGELPVVVGVEDSAVLYVLVTRNHRELPTRVQGDFS